MCTLSTMPDSQDIGGALPVAWLNCCDHLKFDLGESIPKQSNDGKCCCQGKLRFGESCNDREEISLGVNIAHFEEDEEFKTESILENERRTIALEGQTEEPQVQVMRLTVERDSLKPLIYFLSEAKKYGDFLSDHANFRKTPVEHNISNCSTPKGSRKTHSSNTPREEEKGNKGKGTKKMKAVGRKAESLQASRKANPGGSKDGKRKAQDCLPDEVEFLLEAKDCFYIVDVWDLDLSKIEIDGRVYWLMPMLKSFDEVKRLFFEKDQVTALFEGALFLLDISKGLQFLHEHRIIHRDISINNVMYSVEKRAWQIIDFDISRRLNESSYKNTCNNIGTRNYQAPEILKGEDYDFRVDIFSLGAIFERHMNERILQLAVFDGYADEKFGFRLTKVCYGYQKEDPKKRWTLEKGIFELISLLQDMCKYFFEKEPDSDLQDSLTKLEFHQDVTSKFPGIVRYLPEITLSKAKGIEILLEDDEIVEKEN